MVNQENNGWTRPVWDYNQRRMIGVNTDPAPPPQSWGSPYQKTAQPFNAVTGQFANPFATPQAWSDPGAPKADGSLPVFRSPKNPTLDSAIQSVLGQVSSLQGPQKDTVVSSVKNPELDKRLTTQFHNFDTDMAGNRATLADFTKGFLASDPQAKAQTDQEINSVSGWYDGTVAGDLGRISDARRTAVAGALTPQIQSAIRNRNMGSLLGGNDSYLNAQMIDRAGGFGRDAALDNANQLLNNYQYVRGGADRNVGVRNGLLDRYLSRNLMPIQAGQAINAADAQRLYGIGAASAANTNYRVSNPQTELAQKLALLGDVNRIDLGNTFYGVGKTNENGLPQFFSDAATGYRPTGNSGDYGPASDAVINRGQPSFQQQPQRFNPQPSMQDLIAGEDWNWGPGSVASQNRLPGTSFIEGGNEYVLNADGSRSLVGADRLTDLQRWYENGMEGPQPGAGNPSIWR